MSEEALEKIARFFSNYKRLAYRKHETIIRADDIPSGVYLIKKGYVRMYAISEAGQELSIIIYKRNNLFPLIWAIKESPNVQYFEALTEVDVIRAPREELTKFLKGNPDVTYEVLKRVLTREEGIIERMSYMVFGNAYQRVAAILVICCERFGIQKGKNIIVRVPLTHKDIANLVGMTRETTSIELKRLNKEKLISKNSGRIVIHNIEKLKLAAKWYQYV